LLRRLLINTTWASQSVTIRDEVLGSSDGSPGQTFRTTRAPVLEGEVIEVNEQVGGSADHWIRWEAVTDFYASTARDRHYVLDRLLGEVRFGDGQHGMVPPQGGNNVRASVYRTGGGTRGNLPASAVTQLRTTLPYLAGVTNLEPADGGADQETLAEQQQRGPRELRHGHRAITAIDFEDLALQASPEVARVCALTPTFDPNVLPWLDPANPGDLTAHNAVAAGRITLIIVPWADEAQPIPSPDLVRRVKAFITAHSAPNPDIRIEGPDWVEITVVTEVVPTSFQSADALRVAVDSALRRYLHPLYGGVAGQGWPFGQRPRAADLYPLIEAIEGVDHVSLLELTERPLGDVQPERALIFSGAHTIRLAWQAS
jgi:predicted phage baseplate assembly protein